MRGKISYRVLLGLVALVVAFALPVGVQGLHESCASAAAGPTVGLVVDFGDVSGQGVRPGAVKSDCVAWSNGFTGFDALDEAGFNYRLAPSGLVCAINGYPANGCGERTGDRNYTYWSYWKAKDGADSWSYSTIGTATRIRSGVTEGWRFVAGTGNPSDPQPRAAASHDAICGPATPPATPGAPSGPGPDAPSDSSGASTPAPSVATPTTAVAPASDVDESTTSSTPSAPSSDASQAGTGDVVLAAASPERSGPNKGAVIGAVAVVALIAALGTGAVLQSRRRSG